MSLADGGYIPRVESSKKPSKSNEPTVIVSVRLKVSQAKELEMLVRRGRARSKSEAMRMLLDKALAVSAGT